MDRQVALNKNHIVEFLKKSPSEFTKHDIINYITENGIEMMNFMYPAADGRLKTLNFVINDLAYLETILTLGERVDGSSLFPFISAGSSDLYVMPRFRTAFVDPFAAVPTVSMLCSFFDKDGNPFGGAPEQTLAKACHAFTEATGLVFHAMGELEFYVIAPDPATYPATDQRGYHESAPFAKFNNFRTLCMKAIAQTGGQIKYGHSEVGNFTLDGKIYEQNEIEFLPVDAADAADQLVLAKWAIRNLAAKEGLLVTFAPKITVGKAGSGLHIHIRLMNPDGTTATVENGRLSDKARRAIAGLMDTAHALTAFGNTNPTSYFRLVPHQEAPTSICWGDRNRSVLVRVPLGWTSGADMCAAANGDGATPCPDVNASIKQTFEIRSADGSADVYLLLAGIAVGLRHGLEMEADKARALADSTYVDIDIHKDKDAEKKFTFRSLPTNCAESADALGSLEDLFTAYGVFSPEMLAGQQARLRTFDTAESAAALADSELMLAMVMRHFHCG